MARISAESLRAVTDPFVPMKGDIVRARVGPWSVHAIVTDLLGPADPVTGNVYADWLEERGQYEAARMLREAFPLPVEEPR